MIDFEKDLEKLKKKMQNREYAVNVYRAMCNNVLIHKSAPPNAEKVLIAIDEENKKERDKWWRKYSIAIIRFFRGIVLRYGQYTEKKKCFDNKYTFNIVKIRRWASKINGRLLKMEWPFYYFGKPRPKWEWSCTWRYAGDLVANVRGQNEGYLDYYCSGYEGRITEEVRQDFEKIGWHFADDYQ